MGYHQCADLKPKKIDCLDSLQFQGVHLHKHAFKEILITDTKGSIDAEDNGKVFLVEVDCVITLPSIGSGEMGPYTFVNYGKEDKKTGISDVQISIAPAAIDWIAGCDLSATVNTALINTAATAKRGDYLVLVYGGADGWSIAEMRGTWALATA